MSPTPNQPRAQTQTAAQALAQKQKTSLLGPRTVLPLMIFTAVLIVGLRVNDMWHTLAQGQPFSAVAPVTAETAAAKPAEAPAPAAAPAAPTPTAAAPEKTGNAAQREKERQAEEQADDSVTDPGILKQLAERREQLDQRARNLDTREALIRVAEQRVDQKIHEMETLRSQLQSMVNQASAAQQTQLENLVRIYETMKPTEAARIFETLDLPTVLGVVQRMKPARTSAIMAAMAPEKAKEITVALTKQDQLPQIK